MQRSGTNLGIVIIVALLFGVIGGGAAGYFMARQAAPVAPNTPAPAVTCPPSRLEVASSSEATVQAVKIAGDAVVKITSMTEAAQDPLEYLFGGQPQTQVAIGSGVIFEQDGRPMVLTNTHVVGSATRLTVRLVDGRTYEANVEGAEETSDVAVLQLKDPPADLPCAQMGDSSKLQVGEWVVAIGNPYDYDHSVTVGVVSALGYRAVGPNRSQNVIQTDAAINSGNSGGALVNLAGQLVGINYRIFSPTGATVGIGFAIPINSAKQVIYYLSHGGPYVGLGEIVNNSGGLAQYLRLGTAEGVIVVNPAPGGPAAEAGVRPRDVILAIDGVKLSGQDQLRDELLKHRIGDTITLTVLRGREQVQVPIVTGRHPRFQGR